MSNTAKFLDEADISQFKKADDLYEFVTHNDWRSGI